MKTAFHSVKREAYKFIQTVSAFYASYLFLFSLILVSAGIEGAMI